MRLLYIGLLCVGLLPAVLGELGKIKNPGLRFRVSNKGLAYVSVVAREVLNQEMPKIKFPKVELKFDNGPGHGQVDLTDIKMTQFLSPNFSYALQPPKGITWKSKGGSVSVSGDWHAWYKVLFTMRLKGGISASVDDIGLELTADIHQTASALPEVNVTQCKAAFGQLTLDISGGVIQSIVNLFRHQIAARLKGTLEREICEAARGTLQNFANKELQSLPTIVPLYSDFYLHYGLTTDPKVTENYIENNLRAEITWKGQADTPIAPPPLPSQSTFSNASRMMYFWGSDYVLNTFFFSAQKHGAIRFLVNKELDPKTALFLQTTCPAICIGKVIPAIGVKYPNSSVAFVMYTKEAPYAEIKPEGAVVNGTAYSDVFVEPWNVSSNLLFRVKIEFSASLDVFLRRGMVAANMTIGLFKVELVESKIGDILQKDLDMIGRVSTPALQALANFHLNRGIKVPTVEGFGLAKPTLRLLDRTVLIETDIRYKKFYPRDYTNKFRKFRK